LEQIYINVSVFIGERFGDCELQNIIMTKEKRKKRNMCGCHSIDNELATSTRGTAPIIVLLSV
jgi:hypothetical protein